MDPAIATGLVRVAVIGDDSAADLALPTKVSIRELIPVVRRVLASGRDDDDLSSEQAAEPVRPYSLRPFAGTPFSLDATLETMAVKDGEQLLLCVLPPGPAAPPVVEDIADAAAIHSSQQTSVFDPSTMLGPAALVVGVAALVLLCGLAGYGWYSGYPVWAQGTFGALAVTSAVATALLGRRDHGQASGILGVATVLPLGLALAAALPSGTPPRAWCWPPPDCSPGLCCMWRSRPGGSPRTPRSFWSAHRLVWPRQPDTLEFPVFDVGLCAADRGIDRRDPGTDVRTGVGSIPVFLRAGAR